MTSSCRLRHLRRLRMSLAYVGAAFFSRREMFTAPAGITSISAARHQHLSVLRRVRTFLAS